MKLLARLAAAGLGLAVVTVGAAAPAYADVTVDQAKKVVTAQIDGRLAALRALSTAVHDAAHLTASHKSTLSDLIAADTSGLTALRGTVAGETTVAAVRADAKKMVDDYRIYLLVVPKVHLTDALDIEAAAVGPLQQVYDKLAGLVAAAKQAGKSVGDADAKLADMSTQISTVRTGIAGKADALLAIRPGPDGQAINAAIAPERQAAKDGRLELRRAVADGKAVREILKGL
jgi:hypothetical protein